jgi:hypothetical protein
MKSNDTYIKVTDNVVEADDLDQIDEPTEEQLMLMLDINHEIEYTSPYTDNDDYSDLYGSGETFEVGGIFDDR